MPNQNDIEAAFDAYRRGYLAGAVSAMDNCAALLRATALADDPAELNRRLAGSTVPEIMAADAKGENA